MKFFKELGIPFLGFIIFLIFQSIGGMSEIALVILVTLVVLITAIVTYHKKEIKLFIVGCIFGLVIEIGLRYFGYQQVWANSSLFGVPYWLPLIWGFGFVIITRLGIFIRK